MPRMAIGKRPTRQSAMWIATNDLPRPAAHPFYRRLNAMLVKADFDQFVEGLCAKFYAPTMGRPGLAPGIYFRLLMVGYFEGLDSERGIAWRAADSLALRDFLGLGLALAPPDHSTISRTRRLIDLDTHHAVFTWVLQRVADAGLLKGKTLGLDATTLEANAALRSIVRRDSGETYQEFLTKLAHASGIATPTREDLAKLDRKRAKKGSNDDWTHPHDPDARITKMKDGRTHLAHKAEHVVDLDGGAVIAVTIQPADRGDTNSGVETVLTALDELDDVQPPGPDDDREIVADKGYHSTDRVNDWEAIGLRTYISEPNRGRRRWHRQPAMREAVSRNRRRIRGARGQRLLRRRGEYLERPNAHLYETGALRRTHLRGHANILKRVLIHVSGFNVGLIMRQLIGVGTPRGLQGRLAGVLATLLIVFRTLRRRVTAIGASSRVAVAMRGWRAAPTTLVVNSSAAATCTTGC